MAENEKGVSSIPKLTVDQVVEWQYRYYERLGCLVEDRRPREAQCEMARADANEWLQIELTGQEPAPKQKILYIDDM